MEEPLRQAFTHNMKAILIPSIEAITGQVLQQVSTRLEMMDAKKASENKELQSLRGQVEHLTNAVEKLSTAMGTLQSSLSQQQQQQQQLYQQQSQQQQTGLPGKASAMIPNAAEVKAEVKALLDMKEYEAAFTKAVSATTADLAVFCCRNADIMVVLGDDQVHLSQPILLCLMQQLGTVIGSLKHPSDLKVELEWLQDIALLLDPKDPRIHMHVPKVLDQLDANINSRLKQGDQSLKRPLTRLLSIIRGIRN
jgi:enhancer of mRNA-decapping protein 4